MEINRFQIKDLCRNNLADYLIRLVSVFPNSFKPRVLDAGCGTGVPTFRLLEYFDCTVCAVDTDEEALNYFRKRVARQGFNERVKVFQQSVFEMDFPEKYFDVVLAEGLLNVIGFEEGFKLVDKYVKESGYFIIHDEYKSHEEKLGIAKRFGYELLNSIILDEHVWWNEYYKCLEERFQSFERSKVSAVFQNEVKEIELYKEQPMLFKSVYYLFERRKVPQL
jgi:SAM-dependent methyltransferase